MPFSPSSDHCTDGSGDDDIQIVWGHRARVRAAAGAMRAGCCLRPVIGSPFCMMVHISQKVHFCLSDKKIDSHLAAFVILAVVIF